MSKIVKIISIFQVTSLDCKGGRSIGQGISHCFSDFELGAPVSGTRSSLREKQSLRAEMVRQNPMGGSPPYWTSHCLARVCTRSQVSQENRLPEATWGANRTMVPQTLMAWGSEISSPLLMSICLSALSAGSSDFPMLFPMLPRENRKKSHWGQPPKILPGVVAARKLGLWYAFETVYVPALLHGSFIAGGRHPRGF